MEHPAGIRRKLLSRRARREPWVNNFLSTPAPFSNGWRKGTRAGAVRSLSAACLTVRRRPLQRFERAVQIGDRPCTGETQSLGDVRFAVTSGPSRGRPQVRHGFLLAAYLPNPPTCSDCRRGTIVASPPSQHLHFPNA